MSEQVCQLTDCDVTNNTFRKAARLEEENRRLGEGGGEWSFSGSGSTTRTPTLCN